jgi:large subunit ribosomal protein L4e
MKAALYSLNAEKKKEIELPKIFNTKIREDMAAKLFEAERFLLMQPYSPDPRAGRKHSAAGTISHKRHDWKGHYGRGISRVPRKTMSRRGTQFVWIGAEVSSTRGGRRAHPPHLYKKLRRINKKEIEKAMHSALAATANPLYIQKRYSSLDKIDTKLPMVIQLPEKTKTKDMLKLIKSLLKENTKLAIKNKTIRPGKGKQRGRKYKSNAGLLLITSKDEDIKIKGIDVRTPLELTITDLYPLGRLTIFTEKSLEELK